MDTYNEFNTSLEDLHLSELPKEVQDQYYDLVSSVPLIKRHLDLNMPECSDLPKDKDGKILVDVTRPHRLRNMDYFRQSALHFMKYGCYTNLRPNSNPNSEYGKWFRQEVQRIIYGMVRPEDGEWITGDYYFFLNYNPMLVNKTDETGSTNRIISFPDVWEAHYYKFHYLYQARANSKHAVELASRSKGKSYSGASMLARRFVVGESKEVMKKVTCYIVAIDRAKLIGGDQILNKFLYTIDHCAKFTNFPKKRLISTLQNMEWKMGYKDLDTGAEMGTLNSVVGKSLEDESKLRGSRGVLYLFEEAGTFKSLLASWANLRPSVEEGKKVFGLLYAYGTSGDDSSDFSSLQEIMYNPDGYNVYKIDNVYDKEGLGKKWFSLFTPSYINLADCYDKDGNSDVSKALVQLLMDRYTIKYNTSDISTLTKQIAEWAITPQEAIMRTTNNMFPVTEINNRIAEIDADPKAFDDVYVGTLVQNSTGEVMFTPTDDVPIRDFPTKNNKVRGALEIYEMPVYQHGKIPYNRYIASLDNYENDISDTMSLGSCFVLDTFTDRIVAEYTGRPDFVDDLNETVRKICLFYNAKCLYEQNKKNSYAYFKRMNCLHLLADTPDWLRQKDIVKTANYGNSAKGVSATSVIIKTAFTLIRDWLLKPVVMTDTIDDNGQPVTTYNLHFIKNRALLREFSLYNPAGNYDRIMSLVQLMLYREEILSTAQAEVGMGNVPKNDITNDEFFKRFDAMFSSSNKVW